MNTRTLYFPREKDADLEVEVSRDGSIISALGYCPIIRDSVDVLSAVQKSPDWLLRIAERHADIDWPDVDPIDPDDWRASPLEIIKDLFRPESA